MKAYTTPQLDPPAERVETILSDTGTRVLVAGRDLAADTPEHVVYLIDPTLAAAPAERPEPEIDPGDGRLTMHAATQSAHQLKWIMALFTGKRPMRQVMRQMVRFDF